MRFFASLVTFIFILVLGAMMALHFIAPALNGPGPLQAEKDIVIARGSGVSTIGRQLEKEGVVSTHILFRLRHIMEGNPELKAGEYLFPARISLGDAIQKMAKGDVVIRKVSVPEGWTSGAIVDLLRQTQGLTGEITTMPMDGTIAPDTYRYVLGDTRQSLIDAMQKAMEKDVAEAWNARDADNLLQTPGQLVTLASIVEKETALPAERPRVAGVYLNRLRKNMLLQSDPTVIYGITHGTAPMGRALTTGDLAAGTPYNTYTQPGLPPGPIANPGKASLMAAAKPEKHDFLYFVADGSGGHKFTATLEEHEKNVATWRKVEKAANAPAAAAAPAITTTATVITTPAHPAKASRATKRKKRHRR